MGCAGPRGRGLPGWVISEEAVGNSSDILNAILGQKYHQNHPNTHNKQIKPWFATKSEFYHLCVLQYAYAPLTYDLDMVSE